MEGACAPNSRGIFARRRARAADKARFLPRRHEGTRRRRGDLFLRRSSHLLKTVLPLIERSSEEKRTTKNLLRVPSCLRAFVVKKNRRDAAGPRKARDDGRFDEDFAHDIARAANKKIFTTKARRHEGTRRRRRRKRWFAFAVIERSSEEKRATKKSSSCSFVSSCLRG
jgi:hypothetical protein